MDGLGVDKDAIIYWHGKPVQIRQKIELRKFEFWLLVGATIGTLMSGIAAMFPTLPEWIRTCFGTEWNCPSASERT